MSHTIEGNQNIPCCRRDIRKWRINVGKTVAIEGSGKSASDGREHECPGHSVMNIELISLGKFYHVLSLDDDLLSEMLEGRR